ncbi:Uncharacterised protein [Raoultella ornithinolytica]|nr:Uncharacterised protein [Raoultella ornithinolytica]
MLPDIARFLLRLANDQVEQFTRDVNHFTYGYTVEILRNQMFLARTCTNLFFGCIDRNGNFTTDFTINLKQQPGWYFQP